MLTSTEAATLLRVHPSTVKRWCNDGELHFEVTDGGHRRIAVSEALDFADEHGLRTVLTPFRPYESHVWTALHDVERRGSFDSLHALALQWARFGDFERLEQLYLALGRSSELGFEEYCDVAIRGLMTTVGVEWEEGRLRVGDEHMVSEVICSALLALRREWLDRERPVGRRDRPVAVVGSVSGNRHYVGALCVRLLLERAGWKVFYPGPDVPIEDFGIIQMSREASLVCISHLPSGTPGDVARSLTILREFYDRSRPYALAIGGPAQAVDLAAAEGPFEAIRAFGGCRALSAALADGFGDPVGGPR